MEPRHLLSTFIVTTAQATGPGSLVQAIMDSNAATGGGTNTIDFNIPDAGMHTIAPMYLPNVTQSVLIDGYSQPGASANTVAVGDNAVLRIQLDGTNTFSSAGLQLYGLSFDAPNCTVQGLDITNFPGYGVFCLSNGDVIAGNFIGTDPTGMFAEPNQGEPGSPGTVGDGVLIDAHQVTIGGTAPADRNVIAGNTGDGIEVGPNGPQGGQNLIQGNYIGTDATGTGPLGNGGYGVDLLDEETSTSTIIGGASGAAGNVISGNAQGGIGIVGSSNTIVANNQIGTDVTGARPIPNVGAGINIAGFNGYTDSSDNLIGLWPIRRVIGIAGGRFFTVPVRLVPAPNVIAYNGGAGVAVSSYDEQSGTDSVGNEIRYNSIQGNGGLGIDLGADGVTANHASSPTMGPNGFQNYPVIQTAYSGLTGTRATATLHSIPGGAFAVDFYDSPATDPSGYGEGQTYLGTSTVYADASGNASILFFTGTRVAPGSVITATATAIAPAAQAGDTSEFSAAVPVKGVILVHPRPILFGVANQPIGGIIAEASGIAADTRGLVALINWGDGQRSLGQIEPNDQGGFDVLASHTYAHSGLFLVTVTLSDGAGDAGQGSTIAWVAPASLGGSLDHDWGKIV